MRGLSSSGNPMRGRGNFLLCLPASETRDEEIGCVIGYLQYDTGISLTPSPACQPQTVNKYQQIFGLFCAYQKYFVVQCKIAILIFSHMEFSRKNSYVHFNKINMSANSRNFSCCISAFVQQYGNLKKWSYIQALKNSKNIHNKVRFLSQTLPQKQHFSKSQNSKKRKKKKKKKKKSLVQNI